MRGKLERQLARILNRKKTNLANQAGAISFSFDDVPRSACQTGSRILEEHGCRGSFYACGGLTDTLSDAEPFHSREDLVDLKERGHEVACHGYAHLDYQSISLAKVRADLDQNRDFFLELGWSEPPRHFAYPYGCVNPSVKALCAKRFLSARGVRSEVNRNPCDLALLKSVPLYHGQQSTESLRDWIDRAERERSWLIFFTHRVAPDPGTFDCTAELLEFAVQRASESGCRVAPVGEILEDVG